MYKKILVPLDGSELAEQALENAFYLAERADAELLLVSASHTEMVVATATPSGAAVDVFEQPHAQSQSALSTYLHQVRKDTVPAGITAKIKVVEGEAAGVIVDTAIEENIDLIIMSSHGRSGVSRWVMGSVTERVLRQAPCPVLVIREPTDLKKMLITLDGSPISEYAVNPGVELAQLVGAHVTLLSVETAQDLDPAYVDMLDEIEPGLGDVTVGDYYHRTENYLIKTAKWVQPIIEQEVDVAPKIGPVTPVILNHIESNDIDIAVITTHGRTGLKRWLYGSVTEKILRSATCALLVIRPPLSMLNE